MNLFKWFKEIFQDFREREGYMEAMENPSDMAMEILMKAIRKNQPIGHTEHPPNVYGKKVSARLGNTAIEDGWKTTITQGSKGITLKVESRSKHVGYVIRHIASHSIPATNTTGLLRFWWGAPHKWPAKDGQPPGMRRWPAVSHPGTEANPFVERAFDEVGTEMQEVITAGTVRWLDKIMPIGRLT